MISKSITKAAKSILQGDLVVVPTETVYGLAAHYANEAAINKIFDLKKRPKYNPLIVHICSLKQLDRITQNIPEQALTLATHFWPGPLTMVLEKKETISPLITANQKTVAVRMPNHQTLLALIEKIDTPVVAPSANPFMGVSPTKVQHIIEAYPTNCPLILDGGDCSHGMESTIIGFENNQVVLYRYGALAIEKIEAIIGKVIQKNNNDGKPAAPGMLKKHYAPKTPLLLSSKVEDDIVRQGNKKIGLLTFKFNVVQSKVNKQIVLSEDGSYESAMKNFYNALHELDKSELDIIIAEKFPDESLGKVINDRLDRAATKLY
jgi:L-threonylcarbamoyladenylate synthase